MEKDQRHELIENLDKYRIGIDDVFAFKCRSCGNCCRNREDIMLNSRDVYNLATALETTNKQVYRGILRGLHWSGLSYADCSVNAQGRK